MPYFGYSRYPPKVRTRSIIRFVSSAFCSPSGRARKRSSSSSSFFDASCRPCSKRRSPAPGSKFLMLPRIMGTSMVGRSLQRGLVMSISPTPRMPYLSSQAANGVSRFPPARELGQLVEKILILDVLQKGHHLRMRADHVRDVQQRQPHLRRDVVGDGLRERVRRVLLPQPRLQLVVEPPGGLHPRHDHLHASRIELDPLQLLDVRQDEVEERRSGLRLDVALQRRRWKPRCARSARRRWPDRSRSRLAPPPGGAQPGPSSGSDGMKSPRSRMVCSASPISGSDFPRASRRPRGSPVKPGSA